MYDFYRQYIFLSNLSEFIRKLLFFFGFSIHTPAPTNDGSSIISLFPNTNIQLLEVWGPSRPWLLDGGPSGFLTSNDQALWLTQLRRWPGQTTKCILRVEYLKKKTRKEFKNFRRKSKKQIIENPKREIQNILRINPNNFRKNPNSFRKKSKQFQEEILPISGRNPKCYYMSWIPNPMEFETILSFDTLLKIYQKIRQPPSFRCNLIWGQLRSFGRLAVIGRWRRCRTIFTKSSFVQILS